MHVCGLDGMELARLSNAAASEWRLVRKNPTEDETRVLAMVVRTKDDGADKYRQYAKADRWDVPILETRHRQAPEQGYMQGGPGPGGRSQGQKHVPPMPAIPRRPPTGAEILALAATSHRLSVADLKGPSRRRHVVMARHTAMYLCRKHTDLSLPKIGKLFGGRDHSTVSYAIEKISALATSDTQVARQVEHLSEELGVDTTMPR